MKTFHVILHSYNGDNRCVQSVREQLSQDDRLSCIEHYEPVLLNELIEREQRDIILLLDSRALLAPGYMSSIAEAFEKENTVAACGCSVHFNLAPFRMKETIGTSEDELLVQLSADFNAWKQFESVFRQTIPPFDPETGVIYDASFEASSQLAISRAAFTLCGGFDAEIENVGGTVLDLCIRLRTLGNFIARPDASACFIAPPNSFIDDKASNRRDVIRLLRKYPVSQCELVVAFPSADLYSAAGQLEQLCAYIAGENTAAAAPVEEGTLCIDFPSTLHPHGLLRGCLDGQCESFELFGLALPYSPSSFKRAVCSPAWVLLPEILLARLLQEALRVADEVLLPRVPLLPEKRFGDSNAFRLYQPVFLDYIYVENISPFDFSDKDEQYYHVRWHDGAFISFEKYVDGGGKE
ncbi:MAG: hypothetical protein J6L81_02595 [Clostridia bacterium]|nr:hypothetical protein [Clostridia bacterium]